MTTVRADEQRLDVGTVVSLYAIDAREIGGSLYRFAPGPFGGQAVSYGGLAYAPAPIEIRGVKFGTDGPGSRPTMVISRLHSTIVSAMAGADNLRGAAVERLRTLDRYLDGESTADPNRHWPKESWRVEKVSKQTREEVTWQLGSPLDLYQRFLPKRQILRDVCSWEYRKWTGSSWEYSSAQCPYIGSSYYDAKDEAVSAASKDQCSRRLSGCLLRFPDREVPFGGFAGVARHRG